MRINTGAKYNDGHHLGTMAPTRKDATKHQIQMTWNGTQPLRVDLYWNNYCWDVGATARIHVVHRQSSASPTLSKGTTWSKTWSQTQDFCQVGIEAINTFVSQNARVGTLTVRIRDLK